MLLPPLDFASLPPYDHRASFVFHICLPLIVMLHRATLYTTARLLFSLLFGASGFH